MALKVAILVRSSIRSAIAQQSLASRAFTRTSVSAAARWAGGGETVSLLCLGGQARGGWLSAALRPPTAKSIRIVIAAIDPRRRFLR